MRWFAELHVSSSGYWRWLAAVSICLMASLAQAQSTTADSQSDPPSRVARLSYIAGDVGFLPAGAKDWSDVSVNRPLTTGDRLSTGNEARAELELGGAALRVDGQTDFGLLDLNDQLAQVELTQGTLDLAARRLEDGQSYEIDTPTIALVVDQPGSFRVDVDGEGKATDVTVLNGSATVYGENNAQRTIVAGRRYRFDDSSLNTVVITDVGSGDAFDHWSDQRDQRYAQSTTRQYVSDDVVGYQDLDQYGDWQTSDDYGAVWYPTRVAADWAPYRDGHWAYIAPWGWTWVDSSPWGFAPYHYGRWAYVGSRWGWIPGPMAVRPIYAPALVAFVGGGGWSVGVGGPVGWFPLGPGEIYNPWYRASRGYYTRVNVTNIRVTKIYNHGTIINRINTGYGDYRRGVSGRAERHANRYAPRGLTAVSGKVFAGGHRVQGDLLHVDQRQLARTTVLPGGVARRPEAGSFARPRGAHARALPEGGFRRQVVARNPPPLTSGRHDQVGEHGVQPVAVAPSNVRVLGGRRAGLAEHVDDVAPARVGFDDKNRAVGRADQRPGERLGRDRADGNGMGSVPPPTAARVQEGNSSAAQIETARRAQRDSSGFAAQRAANREPLDAPRGRGDWRGGELPSARFARPRGDDARNPNEGRRVTPVTTSPSRYGNRQQATEDAGAAAVTRANATDRPQRMFDQRAASSPSTAELRFQRFDAARAQQRGYVRPSTPLETPNSAPLRAERFDQPARREMSTEPRAAREPSRPAYQPRYQAPPRVPSPSYAPAVRANAAAQHVEPARPERKDNGRVSKKPHEVER